jgi:hypothetical protein
MSPSLRRPFSGRTAVVLAIVLLLVVAAAVVWVLRARDDDPGRLAAAVALAPENSQRLSWTDWSGVRDELDSGVSAAASAEEVDEFLLEGFDADLTGFSALTTSAVPLQEKYGVSPASVEWELLAQSPDVALLFLGLPRSVDFAELGTRLEGLGYERPDSDDGVWVGGDGVLARTGVTEQLSHIVLDEERRLLVGSDTEAAAERWREGERGTGLDDGVSEVVAEVEGSLAAAVYTGDHACVALSMTQASDADRVRAADLVEAAGEVSPLRGYAIAGRRGGDVRVAMAFGSEDQARTNADTRARLAAGPAPGQGTDFGELFELGRVEADGDVVTMELEPLPRSYVLSDLAGGPVLFATC